MSLHGDVLDAHIRTVNFRNLRRLDPWVLLLVVLLGAIGVATLYSANRSFSGGTPYYLKQTVFLGAGVVAAVCIACIDYRVLISFAPAFYLFSLGLLVAVLFIGNEVKGGQRWITIGFFNLQPSEVAKLAVTLMLAWYLGKIGGKIQRVPWLIPAFAIGALPAVLVLVQPNLGTTIVFVPLTFAMVFAAGAKRWHLGGLVLAGAAAAPMGWAFIEDYQRRRILTFLDPASDPSGSGYHTIQSMITVGSGGMTGKGYMQGTQTYLSYLPEHHSDFIYSLFAEEWGFVGGVSVLALFALLFLRILYNASQSEDVAGTLVSVGVVTVLAFHVFVNVAITMGMMPVTGIPLPFMSYGGSFCITTLTGIGVLLSIHARRGMFDR